MDGATGIGLPLDCEMIEGILVEDEIRNLESQIKKLKASIKAHKELDKSVGGLFGNTLYLHKKGDLIATSSFLSTNKSTVVKRIKERAIPINKSTSIDIIRASYVYILLKGLVPVYVGQSSDVFQRISTHLRDKNFDRVRIMRCKKDRKLYWEKKLIEAYKPKYNRTHRKPKVVGIRKYQTTQGTE